MDVQYQRNINLGKPRLLSIFFLYNTRVVCQDVLHKTTVLQLPCILLAPQQMFLSVVLSRFKNEEYTLYLARVLAAVEPETHNC